MKTLRSIHWLLIAFLMLAALGMSGRALAQGDCSSALPPRLKVGQQGEVLHVDGQPLNIRSSAGRTAPKVGSVPEGAHFDVLEGPTCADGIYWWRIKSGSVTGWGAESDGGNYFVGPLSAGSNTPVATAAPISGSQSFSKWDWASMQSDAPDPMALKLPAAYAGNLPALPVDLSKVLFVKDSNLSAAQQALLKQNGFVVVPAGLPQFDVAYEDNNPPMFPAGSQPGDTGAIARPYFVTTDSMLFALHYIFDNLLTDLEKDALITQMQSVVASSYQVAQQQAKEAAGTPLEKPAQSASLFLAVAEELFAPGDVQIPAEAKQVVQLALDANTQAPIPFLGDYKEDFSQYRPRGHYTEDPTLEQYFRGMMWVSRITFLANDDDQTLTALMLLRALRQGDSDSWQIVHDTLTFLIGPVDDLGPSEYNPLAAQIFGSDLSLKSLQDPARLASFRAEVAKLPGPRINGLILPNDTQAQDVASKTRGFRFMGQRFTFDAYVMQQLIYPYVGNRTKPRLLPLGLDVASIMGSDTASSLAKQAGASDFANYDTQTGALRAELGQLTPDKWLENTYGGWFWSLQPLWNRDPKPYPPLMKTDAWLRKDLQTGLSSWTELKHDTVLYTKQPTGFGGGGPPLYMYGYVEPNPQVFARIAVVAAMTYQGLIHRVPQSRGLAPELRLNPQIDAASDALKADLLKLGELATRCASFAEAARKELAGQALQEADYWDIELFGDYITVLLRTLYQGEGDPKPVPLITDVASNPSAGQVLLEAVGGVDYIYVVIPGPKGQQVARGGVFSYYEFVGDINKRPTDDEWRAQLADGKAPPRPDWTKAFLGS